MDPRPRDQHLERQARLRIARPARQTGPRRNGDQGAGAEGRGPAHQTGTPEESATYSQRRAGTQGAAGGREGAKGRGAGDHRAGAGREKTKRTASRRRRPAPPGTGSRAGSPRRPRYQRGGTSVGRKKSSVACLRAFGAGDGDDKAGAWPVWRTSTPCKGGEAVPVLPV